LRRAPRGTCADWLDRREPEPLLFEYPHRAVSRLAAAKGAVTEQEIVDLAEVAARGAARVRHRPPMEIRAGRELDGSVRVMVASYSDRWLPWCSAREEPGADIEDFADNTELARRHTPRLNELLARLADAAAELGGSWQLDRDITDRDLLTQLDDRGVRLDAPRPMIRSFDQAAAGLAVSGVLDALRIAASWLRDDPPTRRTGRCCARASLPRATRSTPPTGPSRAARCVTTATR
jgi:hypothetical protein